MNDKRAMFCEEVEDSRTLSPSCMAEFRDIEQLLKRRVETIALGTKSASRCEGTADPRPLEMTEALIVCNSELMTAINDIESSVGSNRSMTPAETKVARIPSTSC